MSLPIVAAVMNAFGALWCLKHDSPVLFVLCAALCACNAGIYGRTLLEAPASRGDRP